MWRGSKTIYGWIPEETLVQIPRGIPEGFPERALGEMFEDKPAGNSEVLDCFRLYSIWCGITESFPEKMSKEILLIIWAETSDGILMMLLV